jgi:hypothetical protein
MKKHTRISLTSPGCVTIANSSPIRSTGGVVSDAFDLFDPAHRMIQY